MGRGQLVGGDTTGVDRALRVTPTGEPRWRSVNVTIPLGRPDIARDENVVLVWLERTHPLVELRELAGRPRLFGIPDPAWDTVRKVEIRQPVDTGCRGRRRALRASCGCGRQRKNVEHRQRDRGAKAPEHRTP